VTFPPSLLFSKLTCLFVCLFVCFVFFFCFRSASEQVDDKAPSMGAKSLCIPVEQPEPITADTLCVNCGKHAKSFTLFGRSY